MKLNKGKGVSEGAPTSAAGANLYGGRIIFET